MLVTCSKIRNEVATKAWDALTDAAQKAHFANLIVIRVLLGQVHRNADRLIDQGVSIDDDKSELGRVRALFQSIWADPSKEAKRLEWARVKKRPVESGPPSGADHVILSTAASLAKDNDVELLTFDHDFTIFRDEILQSLSVTVVNAYELT